eukprot:2996736-Pyramimonas_sp.AAC.1
MRWHPVDYPSWAGPPAPPDCQPRLIVEIRDDIPASEVGLTGLARPCSGTRDGHYTLRPHSVVPPSLLASA